MLKSTIQEYNLAKNTDYLFIRNSLAIAIEYGYYNAVHGGFTNKETVLFCDIGSEHTTLCICSFYQVFFY